MIVIIHVQIISWEPITPNFVLPFRGYFLIASHLFFDCCMLLRELLFRHSSWIGAIATLREFFIVFAFVVINIFISLLLEVHWNHFTSIWNRRKVVVLSVSSWISLAFQEYNLFSHQSTFSFNFVIFPILWLDFVFMPIFWFNFFPF